MTENEGMDTTNPSAEEPQTDVRVPTGHAVIQGYLKTLKPKSDGQAELMTAMDTHNLVMALGPAGTARSVTASRRNPAVGEPALAGLARAHPRANGWGCGLSSA